MILYGIPNCDSVKKARTWLAAQGIAYAFHDYRKVGADRTLLRDWIERAGWERVLNRSGTTFRRLPDADKQDLDAEKAAALMVAHPSAIKRPILVDGDRLLVGFDAAAWQAALA